MACSLRATTSQPAILCALEDWRGETYRKLAEEHYDSSGVIKGSPTSAPRWRALHLFLDYGARRRGRKEPEGKSKNSADVVAATAASALPNGTASVR